MFTHEVFEVLLAVKLIRDEYVQHIAKGLIAFLDGKTIAVRSIRF